MVFPDFQPQVPEEPVCTDFFRQNQVFTSLHLRSPVHVVPSHGLFWRQPSTQRDDQERLLESGWGGGGGGAKAFHNDSKKGWSS